MKFILTFFLFFMVMNSVGQIISLEELTKMTKYEIPEIESFLISKNFSLSHTKDDNSQIVLNFEQETTSKLNSGRTVKYKKYEGIFKLISIKYSTIQKNEYLKAKEYTKMKKFKFIGTKVFENTISSLYELGNYFIILKSNSGFKDDNITRFTWYDIEIQQTSN